MTRCKNYVVILLQKLKTKYISIEGVTNLYYNRNFFFVCYKNGRKCNQVFKLLLFELRLHFITSNQTSTLRKINFSLISSIYLVFYLLEMERKLTQTKVYCTIYYSVQKETTQKPFLQYLCYWYGLLL